MEKSNSSSKNNRKKEIEFLSKRKRKRNIRMTNAVKEWINDGSNILDESNDDNRNENEDYDKDVQPNRVRKRKRIWDEEWNPDKNEQLQIVQEDIRLEIKLKGE
jgi:hypothetical protein